MAITSDGVRETVTAISIAVGALRKVGALPPSKRDANPFEARVALAELDKIASHHGAAFQLPWIRETFVLPLERDKARYDLFELTSVPLGTSPRIIDRWDICHVIEPLPEITLAEGQVDPREPDRHPVELYYEDEWFKRDDRWRRQVRRRYSRAGRPVIAWIEHRLKPAINVLPVPDILTDGWQLELVGQRETKSLTDRDGDILIEMPRSWRMFLEFATAVACGTGPIRRMSQGDLAPLVAEREKLWGELKQGSVPDSRKLRVSRPHPF